MTPWNAFGFTQIISDLINPSSFFSKSSKSSGQIKHFTFFSWLLRHYSTKTVYINFVHRIFWEIFNCPSNYFFFYFNQSSFFLSFLTFLTVVCLVTYCSHRRRRNGGATSPSIQDVPLLYVKEEHFDTQRTDNIAL